MQGFYQGIQQPGGDGTCINDVESLSGLLTTIYQDAEKALGGSMSSAVAVFTNLKKLISSLDSDNSECNIDGFFKTMTSLTTPEGWVKVVLNVGENWPAIDTTAQTMNTCGSNPTSCGFSVGTILRLSLGWGLGPSSAKPVQADAPATWFDGFLAGLENNPNSANQCVSDLNSLQGLVADLIQDVQKVLTDYSEVFQLIADAKTFWADVQKFGTPCNVPELVTILQSLSTPEGINTVVNNFKINVATIMSDAPAIMNCSSDVATCGQNAGIIVRLVLGWSI